MRDPSQHPATVDLAKVRDAAQRISHLVKRTPLYEVKGKWLPRSDVRLLLKLECQQTSGSFKARGARHFLSRLLEGPERPSGVVTYSSGNHGRAVAEAAQQLGLTAVVTVPDDIDATKAEAIQAAHAELVKAGGTSTRREQVARQLAQERGYALVPPFDHEWIVAGQGTVALEIYEDVPDLAGLWVPVGGGGLAAGAVAALGELRPGACIYAVEPEGAAPLAASLASGRRMDLERSDSMADGLLPLGIGELNWKIFLGSPVQSVTVSEHQILDSLRRLRHDLRIAAEPSGAVAAAPLLFSHKTPAAEAASPGTHVAIVSGGNVSPERLTRLLEG
ncbi:MAG: pyridoxal-phosphate dependent enzyme [Planctomycetota bacterium]